MAYPRSLVTILDEALEHIARSAFRAGFAATTDVFNGTSCPHAEREGVLQHAEDAALTRILGEGVKRSIRGSIAFPDRRRH